MKIKFIKIRKWGSYPLLYFLSLSMLLTSCSQEDEVTLDKDDTVVSFSGELRSTSDRGNLWSPNDTIGLYMVDPILPMYSPNAVYSAGKNRKYVADDNDIFNAVSGDEIIYPNNGIPVRFVAYYPYTNDITQDYWIPVNVEDQSSPSKIDVLISNSFSTYSKTSKMQTLPFKHALCKLSIAMVAGEGFTNNDLLGITASLEGVWPSGFVPLNEGGSIISGASKPISLLKSGSTFSGIIIPFPAGYPYSKVIFTTSTGDKYSWDIGSTAFLTAGTDYSYTITIKKTGISVEVNSIAPWNYSLNVLGGVA